MAASTTSPESVVVRVRFANDHGPLFNYIKSLPPTAVRASRLTQLAYLGLMVENGQAGSVGLVGRAHELLMGDGHSPASSGKRSGTAPSIAEATSFAEEDVIAAFGLST